MVNINKLSDIFHSWDVEIGVKNSENFLVYLTSLSHSKYPHFILAQI